MRYRASKCGIVELRANTDRPLLCSLSRAFGMIASIRIGQALDKHAAIGKPKRKASHRSVPIGPHLTNTLKRWVTDGLAGGAIGEQTNRDGTTRKLQMFLPNERGRPLSYHNFYHRIWQPLLIAAGIADPTGETDAKGHPILAPRYAPTSCATSRPAFGSSKASTRSASKNAWTTPAFRRP
jgi:hypothetical protein